MDLNLNENQKMFRRTARDFLEKECPRTPLREAETSAEGYSKQLQRKMAELGWLGLGIGEEYGGSGGDLIDMVVLYEELGRALVPGPHFISAVVCGQTILRCGSEEQKETLLPRIARGELVATLAQYEAGGDYSPSSLGFPAVPDGRGYLLEGTKMFVPYAHVCDYLICAARTDGERAGGNGITLFLVDGKAPGLACTPLVTLAGDKQSEVIFRNVRVPRESILGALHGGWLPLNEALQIGMVLQCAEMAGGAEKVLELTVNYMKERVQFNRPLGSFQAIQHHCANMAVNMDATRCITYEAACKVRNGEVLAPEVAMAKSFASTAYRQVTNVAHQLFGGAAYVVEHDLNFYYRRAKALEVALGDVRFQTDEVARRLNFD